MATSHRLELTVLFWDHEKQLNPQELVFILIITFSLPFSVPAMDIMFTSTSVTRNAIVEIEDAFLDVLATNACKRVFVAAIASVTAVVVAHMTGHTARIVIAV